MVSAFYVGCSLLKPCTLPSSLLKPCPFPLAIRDGLEHLEDFPHFYQLFIDNPEADGYATSN
jgi:hypothetical protein